MKQMICLLALFIMAACSKPQESGDKCACGPGCTCDESAKNEKCGCPSCVCVGK